MPLILSSAKRTFYFDLEPEGSFSKLTIMWYAMPREP